VNYAELADIKLPAKRRQVVRKGADRREEPGELEPLYRLTVVKQNQEEGLVKVRYVGYGEECDEWRVQSEILDISEGEGSCSEQDYEDIFRGPVLQSSVFEDLAYRVKSLLTSNRKGDPSCRIIMPFDQVSFDALVLRSSLLTRTAHYKQKAYTVTSLTKLDDLLVTVKLYLKQNRGKTDYQLLDNGTLIKRYFGKHHQLVFSFVRGDGVAAQWNDVIRQCR